MKDPQKISIRFFDDREVRALWDEKNAKWWFSVLDIIAVLTNQDDCGKTRNYWKYLKAKLKREGSQLVSTTTQLKLTAADGKKYKSDMLDYEGIIALGKTFPGTKANRFIEWFTYSDGTIDGKSKTKAYALFGSSFIGRSARIWLDLILKKRLKKSVDWSKIGKTAYRTAMVKSPVDATPLKLLLENALTNEIYSREMFMKGIDYSYYYEEID
jgi:hypothetical protein